VSYWVDLSLGQGEFPRDPSLRPYKLGEVVRVKTQWEYDS
jgi:hypothetical protein